MYAINGTEQSAEWREGKRKEGCATFCANVVISGEKGEFTCRNR